MGSAEDGQAFTSKHAPLFAAGNVELFCDADRELYQSLELRRPSSLTELYKATVDLQTVNSGLQALKGGFLPTYSAGGDLLQLGGTVVIEDGAIIFSHLDKTTGGHAPLDLLLKHSRSE